MLSICIVLSVLTYKIERRGARLYYQLPSSTGTESNVVPNLIECHFRVNAYFKVLDAVIINMEKQFSPESLKIAVAVDNFLKFNFDDSKYFVEHYKVFIILLKFT